MIEEHQNSWINLDKHPQRLKIFSSRFGEPFTNSVFVPSADMTGDPNQGELYMINLKTKQEVKTIIQDPFGISDFEMISRLPSNNLVNKCKMFMKLTF